MISSSKHHYLIYIYRLSPRTRTLAGKREQQQQLQPPQNSVIPENSETNNSLMVPTNTSYLNVPRTPGADSGQVMIILCLYFNENMIISNLDLPNRIYKN